MSEHDENPQAPPVEEATVLDGSDAAVGAITHPAKLMRLGLMAKQVLDEVNSSSLDAAGRARMKELYDDTVRELSSAISPELASEMTRLAGGFDEDTPSEAELRIAQAQLVGWLEGLFQGIQASVYAQQMAAQQQLEQMRRQSNQLGAEPDRARRGAAPYL